jgi:hypothetical protein
VVRYRYRSRRPTLRGRNWKELKPTDKPIGSLDDFDSLVGVETTVMVEEKLACGDLQIESLFVSEDGKRALTVREIAQRIGELLVAVGQSK